MNNRQAEKITALGVGNSEGFQVRQSRTATVQIKDLKRRACEKIVVHAPDKSTGDCVQEVEIYLKFIGRFDLPEAELTLEEQAKQEKERARRAYYREKSKERYERKKRERAQIAAQS